jgi:two-component system CheB/CheR fusion protein
MEPELQKKISELFYYSLKPGGIMLLGTAETLGFQNAGFKALDNKLKLFKRDTIFPGPELSAFPSSFSHGKSRIPEKLKTPQATENIQSLADQVLLQTYAPASVLVNDQGDILYMTGRIGKYLEPVAGKANYNIFVMAREGLRNDLTGAFRKALQSFDPVLMRNARVGTNGGTIYVDVTFQCLTKPETLKGLVMIVFTDVPGPVENEKGELKKRTRKSTGLVEALELELQRKNEDLQGTREEMQTSQEELKSTNEELQSTNEELQSTNEELTTSKEEMQSLNEELQTVNIELQSKVADLLRATDDMSNLLNNTGIATLFLDRDLNIRRFTDSVTKIFKLRPGDVGRPFTDQVSELIYPQIGTHCREVLKTLTSVEAPIATNDGRWFNVRILPYRTLDDHIDGLVLTFVDITTAKRAEDELAISETSFRRLFESAKDGILILDAGTGKIKNVNPFLVEMLGYSKEQFLEKAIWEIGFFKDIIANKAKFLELQQKELVRYENLPLETAKGSRINVEFVSNVYLVANVKVIQCFVRENSKLHEKERHGNNNKG